MKIATINVPDAYIDCIETLVNLGFYPSRSECVREAIKQFLNRETGINDHLQKESFETTMKKQMQEITGGLVR